MRTKLFLSALILVSFQCNQRNKKSALQGTWKIDSVYSFYNGFGYTKYDVEEQPLRHYLADRKLMMTRGEEKRFFIYALEGDSLIHRDADKKFLERFFVERLDGHNLVLRKELQPVFQGNNQRRYEIRYFSKVEGYPGKE